MSRTVRKLQKKGAVPKPPPKSSSAPPNSDIGQALDKFFKAEEERRQLTHELDAEVSQATQSLLSCLKSFAEEQKSLRQHLQETRRKYETATDDLAFAQEEIREAQAKIFKLEQDKLKLEQKLVWANVEIKSLREDLQRDARRAEEKAAIEVELEILDRDIARYERKLAQRPESRDLYESRLKTAREDKARCEERLKQLQGGDDTGNFPYDSPFALLDEESNRILQLYTRSRSPTDEIILRTDEDETRLLAAWCSGDTIGGVPNDFLKARTVPLTDFVIKFAADDFSARVILDTDDKNFPCGAVIIKGDWAGLPKGTGLAFFLRTINDTLWLSSILGCFGSAESIEEKLNANPVAVWNRGLKALVAWYGVEHALLNPLVRERVAACRLKEFAWNSSGDGEGSVVKYVKQITTDDLLIGSEPKKVEWHVDKWGVVGHWREYANGKKVWVRPYEKGRKRGQPSENPDLRERIVVTE